jgi:hypothetical protein
VSNLERFDLVIWQKAIKLLSCRQVSNEEEVDRNRELRFCTLSLRLDVDV